MKQDTRYSQIGHKHRALSRWYMIKHRIAHSDQVKNQCYKDIEIKCTKEEFVSWFQARDFKGASVDRINSNGHYELDNMQVISLAENIRKDKTIFNNNIGYCPICHQEKHLDDFVKDKRRMNGHGSICKQCDALRSTGV